jgi:ligand-binding sensor domain-containing protein
VITNYTLLSSGVPDNSVISVQLDQLNRPWFGSTAQGIFTDNGNQTWLSFNVMNSPLPSNSITAFELDEMDNFLIGTHQDGFVLRENTSDWYHFNTANSPLPDNHILACTRDSNEVIWLGTFEHGLVKMWVSQSELAEIKTKQLHVYPNPATQNSTVFWSENDQFQQLLILDLTGKIVYQQSLTAGQHAIELTRLNPSMYILEFQNDRQMVRTQLQIAP